MNSQTKKRIQKISWVLFVLYILFLTYLLFLSEGFGHRLSEHLHREFRYNLIPFQEIRRFWVYRDLVGGWAAFLNIGGNILGFCPFGFILPVLSRRYRKVFKTVRMGFYLSLFVECMQLLLRVGSFDVDDIILNTLGTLLGFLVFRVTNLVRRWYYEKKV